MSCLSHHPPKRSAHSAAQDLPTSSFAPDACTEVVDSHFSPLQGVKKKKTTPELRSNHEAPTGCVRCLSRIDKFTLFIEWFNFECAAHSNRSMFGIWLQAVTTSFCRTPPFASLHPVQGDPKPALSAEMCKSSSSQTVLGCSLSYASEASRNHSFFATACQAFSPPIFLWSLLIRPFLKVTTKHTRALAGV